MLAVKLFSNFRSFVKYALKIISDLKDYRSLKFSVSPFFGSLNVIFVDAFLVENCMQIVLSSFIVIFFRLKYQNFYQNYNNN